MRHPYMSSSVLSSVIITVILFVPMPEGISRVSMIPIDAVEFTDIDLLWTRASRRVTNPGYAVNGTGETNPLSIDRQASGTSDDPEAEDLSFGPSIVPPKPVSTLVKRYPAIARELEVEAELNLELLIMSDGKVSSVRVTGIRLLKTLPPDLHTRVAEAFAHDAVEILKQARFTPPIVQGKQVPVRFEIPMHFRLDKR